MLIDGRFNYGGCVKRIILIAIPALFIITMSCNKQRALDRIMADPQMRSYLLQQMLTDQTTRAEMADSIMNDSKVTDAFVKGLVDNEASRDVLLQKMIASDPTGVWIVGKLSENADILKEIKKAAKK